MKKSGKSSAAHRNVLERPLRNNENTERPEEENKYSKVEAKTAEITKEDLDALGSDELANDGGEDEPLKQRTHSVDFTGKDLDVPGAELDDDNEKIGSEDEENNPYSLGGERHDD